MLWGLKSISKFHLTQRSGIAHLVNTYSMQGCIIQHKITGIIQYKNQLSLEEERGEDERRKVYPASLDHFLLFVCTVCELDHPYEVLYQLTVKEQNSYGSKDTLSRAVYIKECSNNQRSCPARHITSNFIRS